MGLAYCLCPPIFHSAHKPAHNPDRERATLPVLCRSCSPTTGHRRSSIHFATGRPGYQARTSLLHQPFATSAHGFCELCHFSSMTYDFIMNKLRQRNPKHKSLYRTLSNHIHLIPVLSRLGKATLNLRIKLALNVHVSAT